MRDVWVLRLVPPGRFGGLAYSVVTLAALLSIYALAGIFGERASRAAPANVAVFFAAILAYMVPVYAHIVARSREALADLSPHLGAEAFDSSWASVGRAPPRRQLAIAVLGFAAGLLHNLALTNPIGVIAVVRAGPADAAVVAGTFLVWLVMTTVIIALIDNARLFARLGARVRVDLLQPRALTPFGRVAVISTLAIIGAQAAFPILWINSALSALASVPGLVATGVPLLFLFFMPVLPVHRAIAAARRAALAHLDADVAALTRADSGTTERLLQLAPLLAYRQEVERTSEWPFDTTVYGRLGLYLVIPPLTWIAAAMVERLLDVAL